MTLILLSISCGEFSGTLLAPFTCPEAPENHRQMAGPACGKSCQRSRCAACVLGSCGQRAQGRLYPLVQRSADDPVGNTRCRQCPNVPVVLSLPERGIAT